MITWLVIILVWIGLGGVVLGVERALRGTAKNSLIDRLLLLCPSSLLPMDRGQSCCLLRLHASAPTPAIAQPDLASLSGNGSSHGEPHSPDEEAQRIMVLQSVLRQRGCYGGPIDGVWSEPTQRAMGDYLQRANAQFPIGVPDPRLRFPLGAQSRLLWSAKLFTSSDQQFRSWRGASVRSAFGEEND